MTIEIAMRASGFLYLFILVLYIPMAAFGYQVGWGDYDSDAQLQKINSHPKKFRIGIALALIDHASIIALAILLFIAFGSYSLILGIIWTTFRIGEGLIQLYNEKDYWGLLNIARQYSVTSGAKKTSLSDLALTVFQTHDFRYTIGQFLWSIGTLAFSIALVTSGVVPPIIGWLGIVASILGFFNNAIKLVKPDLKILKALGGIASLPTILFELIIGGWLIFY